MSRDEFHLFSTYSYLFGNKHIKSKLSISRVFLMYVISTYLVLYHFDHRFSRVSQPAVNWTYGQGTHEHVPKQGAYLQNFRAVGDTILFDTLMRFQVTPAPYVDTPSNFSPNRAPNRYWMNSKKPGHRPHWPVNLWYSISIHLRVRTIS